MNEDERIMLPTNVKQIGSVTGSDHIYMEDYACTYLQQYARSEPGREKAAFLVGKRAVVEDEEVLLISGVIRGKYTVRRNGMTELTEKSWQYAAKQLKLYFEGLEVVGWAYFQPGFEDYLSDSLLEYQRRYEDKGLNVLYLSDPTERVSSFYKWEGDKGAFAQVKGYMVYYEKNEGMHEYMLENKLKTVVKEDTATKEPTTDEKLVRTMRSPEPNKNRVRAEQRRLSNLLGSVSFVMLLVCFVMGAGLVRSDERINILEQELSILKADMEGVQSVFAAQGQGQEQGQGQVQTQAQGVEVTTESDFSNRTVVLEPTTALQVTEAMQVQEYISYTIEEGDTLLKICKNRYGNGDRVEEIMELNDIEDPGRLFVGMELRLPKE